MIALLSERARRNPGSFFIRCLLLSDEFQRLTPRPETRHWLQVCYKGGSWRRGRVAEGGGLLKRIRPFLTVSERLNNLTFTIC
jgi:hypothetical protein